MTQYDANHTTKSRTSQRKMIGKAMWFLSFYKPFSWQFIASTAILHVTNWGSTDNNMPKNRDYLQRNEELFQICEFCEAYCKVSWLQLTFFALHTFVPRGQSYFGIQPATYKDRKEVFIRLPFYLFVRTKAWNTKLQCLKFKCSSYSFYTNNQDNQHLKSVKMRLFCTFNCNCISL